MRDDLINLGCLFIYVIQLSRIQYIFYFKNLIKIEVLKTVWFKTFLDEATELVQRRD